jgi:HK97 family phage prohead protease
MQVRATPENGPGTGKAVVSVIGLEYEIGWGWTEIILPGCFDESIEAHPTIPIYHQHNWDDGPIGSGTPSVEGDQLIVAFGLYLGMGDLVDRVYRGMQDKALEEWSIGFWADEITWEKENPDCDQIAKGDLAEASVCVRGANPETGTLELAQRGMGWVMGDEPARREELSRIRSLFSLPELGRRRSAIAVHHTATSTDAWDGPAQEKNLDNEDGASVYKKAYAWVDPDKDADTKAAYKFIHHFVASDGTVGDASTVACSSGIGVLNGGRGGTTIPEGDVQGVYDHLAAHLKDAGMEPPELKSRSASDDDEPTAGELAQSVDALIDQVVLLLEADPPDTKGALDLLVSADSTVDDLLEALGVPDDDDVAEAEGRAAAARALGEAFLAAAGSSSKSAEELGAAFRSLLERASADDSCARDGCGHMASVHSDTDDGDNTGACSTPDCGCTGFQDPDGTPTGGGDPADDESSRALRLMATPWGREQLRKMRDAS